MEERELAEKLYIEAVSRTKEPFSTGVTSLVSMRRMAIGCMVAAKVFGDSWGDPNVHLKARQYIEDVEGYS